MSLRKASLDDPYVTRTLVHGTITHGLQYMAKERRRLHTTYYGSASGVGIAIENTRHSAQRVGMIGLGTGTIASYGRAGDYYRIYEINPLVLEVARREFTYLLDCPAKVDVVLGDARLSLEREPSQQFDVLAVDAFSGDAIPVHLLTLETFRLYFRHLRPDGILAVHVSNSASGARAGGPDGGRRSRKEDHPGGHRRLRETGLRRHLGPGGGASRGLRQPELSSSTPARSP